MTLEETLVRVVNAAGDKLPQVTEIAGRYYQASAIRWLVVGAFAAVACGVFVKATKWVIASDWDFEGKVPALAGLGLCVGASGLIAAVNLLDIMNWIAAFSPDLALFKGAVEAVRK